MHEFEALARRGYVTWAVVAANGVLFLVTLAVAQRLSGFDAATLLNLGALSARHVAEGQWWRLLTGFFLHGSALHLGFNMLALFQAGLIVERLYAHAVFASIYLLSGFAGGCASIFWRQDVVSLGASGAVFGVYGALLAYLVLQRGSVPRAALRRLSIGAVFFIAYSLAYGVGQNNIDNAAHVGGLIAGILIGMGTARPLHSTWSGRAVARAAMAGLAVFAMGLALLWFAPDPQRDYQRALELDRALKDLAQADDEADRRMAGLRTRIRQGESSTANAMLFMERELLTTAPVITISNHISDRTRKAIAA